MHLPARLPWLLLLLLGASVLLLQSSVPRQRVVNITPEQILRAARLDDPVGARTAWLQQQGHNSSTLDAAVLQQFHGDGSLPSDIPAVLCADTCYKARDGICDEGRRGNLSADSPATTWVYCDLGTDCGDCGPWQGVQHTAAWTEAVGPVQYVRMHSHPGLRLQQVPYAPAFLFAHPDPARDWEHSARMSSIGVMEPGITQVFVAALAGHCNGSDPAVVLDVGAHCGWYSLMAAALGCRAVAIEPVPLFRAFLEFSAARNHVTHLIELLPAVVAADTARIHTLSVPLSGQLGTAGLHSDVHQHPDVMQVPARALRLDDLAFPAGLGSNDDSSSNDSSSSIPNTWQQHQQQQQRRRRRRQLQQQSSVGTPISSRPFNQQQQQLSRQQKQQQQSKWPGFSSRFLSGGRRVHVLKVDVEGHEPEALATAQRLLSSGRVAHILFEYSPGYFYERVHEMHALPAMLLGLLRHGYRLLHLPWHVANDDGPIKAAGGWNASRLPEMDSVTQDLLAYDVWTAEQLKNGSLPGMHGPRSWPCPEMAASGMAAAAPELQHMALHVHFHPLSFASQFVFNTNLWAALHGTLQPPGRDLATERDGFPVWYDPASQWFPLHAGAVSELQQESGLPWAACAEIPPAHQVAHRCRCRDWDVCGEHQVAVQVCLRKHTTGYENLLERGLVPPPAGSLLPGQSSGLT